MWVNQNIIINNNENNYLFTSKKWQEFSNCIKDLDYNDLKSIDGVDDRLINKLNDSCNEKLQFYECLKSYTASFEEYLTEDKSDILHNIEDIIIMLIDYVCNDEGQTLITLRSTSVTECYKQMNHEIYQCLSPHIRHHEHFGEVIQLFKINSCAEFKEDGNAIRNCIVLKYDECLPALGRFYSDVFDKIFEYFSCQLDWTGFGIM